MFYKFLYVLCLASLSVVSHAADTINFIFAGDIMQHMPQVNAAETKTGHDYEPCFRYVKNEISAADVAIGNLEFTMAGKPYSGYPQFCAPDAIASALKDAGFDIMVTANNHSCDKYAKGITRTLDVLDSIDMAHTGTFRDSIEKESTYPLIYEKNKFKIAILNYTYGTNGIAIPYPCIVNLIDSASIIADIEKAKLANPDIIISLVHWGVEYARKPSAEQRKLAELMASNGVHLVIGSHPHVMQHAEKRYSPDGRCDKLIAYSLGNFVSNQSNTNTDGGMMLKVSVVKDEGGTRITNASYGLVWVYKPVENKKRTYFILPAANYKKSSGFMSADDSKKLNTFIQSSRKLLSKENIGVCEFTF